MKKTIVMLLILMGSMIDLQSQSTHPAYDIAMDLKHKKGEIIVKFKDDATINRLKSAGTITTGNSSIDALTRKWGIKGMDNVFKDVPRLKSAQFITMPDGTQKQLSQLYNIYKFNFSEEQDVDKIINDFKSLPDVEYAEANGVAYIHDLIAATPVLNERQLSLQAPVGGGKINPNDPFYGAQWYLPQVKADSLWNYTTGDSAQVIAILDTGVDWNHPDLKNKIWRNTHEIPDNGMDDDGNGFVDDIRGWDFVNKDNNPSDDNSHGTHVAGIAAAESNNGIGIAGVSWGAKIMPVKVFQSNGIGYFSQIAEGFWYAAKNGGTIFNNSWSSGGESITIRLAMEYAYSKGLIVAAVGNMNTKTDQPCPPWPPYEPNFPACYNWVLGVEATDQNGNNTWFSNFDPTGPVISDGRPYGSIYYNDHDYNYEMRAPGLSFMSTVPNGQYRAYSGTSMACPLVAGSIALMKSYNPNLSNEEVFAKLIQPIKVNKMQAGVLDILKCTLTDPPADLYFKSYTISDSQDFGGDHDGRADAGETIDMKIKVKNVGGMGDSTFAKIRFSEFEDRTVAQIIKNKCTFGTISAYASQTSFDAFKIKIDPKVVDARIISLQVLIYQKNSQDTLYQTLTTTIEHGIEIKGTYSKLHLRPDAYYIVTEPAVIDSLIIDPGVTLRFRNTFIMANKYLSAIGKPDSMIVFRGADNAFFKGIITTNAVNEYQYCIFQDGTFAPSNLLTNPRKIHHCIFRLNGEGYNEGLFSTVTNGSYKYNVISDNIDANHHSGLVKYYGICKFKYNIIVSNESPLYSPGLTFFNPTYPQCMDSTIQNVFMNNESFDVSASFWNGWPMGIYKMKENYWGTTDKNLINKHILDFYEDQTRPVLEVDKILDSPPAECHGVVWKVEINDQNPQDVPITIGNGPSKFRVYFNRPMDPKYQPFLTFGVRFPYTQNAVEDSASWSPDHKIWTGYKTFTKNTGDGENIIRVAYAKDFDHFDIPIERSRFKFVVQAASSQSVEFMATPGIGKVKLEWPKGENDQVIGYNLYRFNNYSVNKNSLKINSELITDTIYTDFQVIPDSSYYYAFSMINSDLSESDLSKVVSAKVLKSANGDANGDLQVNVLDITTIVSYLLNNNPQPFIAEAADVNSDTQINVLDVVGVVNLVLGNKSDVIASSEKVNLYMANDTLFADIPVAVGGIQMDILGVTSLDEIMALKALKGFESGYSAKGNSLRIIFYSLSGKTLEAGKRIPLIKLQKGAGITNIIFGDKAGSPIGVQMLSTEVWNLSEQLDENAATLGQNQPNPFTDQTIIPVKINEPVDEAVVRIVNMFGHTVETIRLQNPTVGEHQLAWNSKGRRGFFAYLLDIRRGEKQFTGKIKKMIVQ